MSPHAPPRAILRVLSDERLARHAAGGSQQAFATLYERHERELLASCRSIVRHEDDARDALQSTMLKAWDAIGRRGDAPLRPWLFRIARNESITVLRRRRPAAELHEDVTTRTDVHEEAAGRAELADVLDGIDDLSERQREALVLRTLGDTGYDEIARRQATSPQAVRQSVAHARRTLRRRRVAGLIPIPAWLADLAASAGGGGAPAIQAGVAKTAVGVTAAVAVVGGAMGPADTHRRPGAQRGQTTAEARASSGAAPSAARAASAPSPSSTTPVSTRVSRDAAPGSAGSTPGGERTTVRELSSTAPTRPRDDAPRRGERVAGAPATPGRRGGEPRRARRFAGDHPAGDTGGAPRRGSWPQRRGSDDTGDGGHTAWTRTGRGGDRPYGGADRGAPAPDPSPDVSADRDAPVSPEPDTAPAAPEPDAAEQAPSGAGAPSAP